MSRDGKKRLKLTFHGRIIDHLGIQMYQSPVAAIAELIANSWDADAENVYITLPDELGEDAEIIIRDNGLGMSLEECEGKYLNVGWCRRGDNPDEKSLEKGRPILGRKGIGKFAGFGIAGTIEVTTISKLTGEKTVFELNLEELRGDRYVSENRFIDVKEYEKTESNKKAHGTTVILKLLTIGRRPSPSQFPKSMARRFLLLEWSNDFKIFVGNKPIPDDEDLTKVEFQFPRDYRDLEKPEGIKIEDGWGFEKLENGREIKWRIRFFREPIDVEELRGIAIFSKIKLAQKPFLFNLTGGLGGQHGQEYICGKVLADYIDLLKDDIIATERQRINWEHEEAIPLEKWGQHRTKQILKIWKDRRGEVRANQIENKILGFSSRLEKFQSHERRTVKSALTKLARISTLSDGEFKELAESVLLAWEQGRLKELINSLSDADNLTEDHLLHMLIEEDVLSALNIAEAVKTKLMTVGGLMKRIKDRQLENAVRDYIADNPWLISPKLQTCIVEKSLKKTLKKITGKYYIQPGKELKRIDLLLSQGNRLILLEFMQPGLTLDFDHLNRYEQYFRTI